jgi:hypothetical protein
LLGGLEPAKTRDDLFVFIRDDWRGPTKLPYAIGNLPDLFVRIFARYARAALAHLRPHFRRPRPRALLESLCRLTRVVVLLGRGTDHHCATPPDFEWMELTF